MAYFYEDKDKVVHGTALAIGDDDTLYVKAGVTIGSSTGHSGVITGANALLQVYGSIISLGGVGLETRGFFADILIGPKGSITGGSLRTGAGISLGGNANHIVNDGLIAGGTAIFGEGTSNTIVNTGALHGLNGPAIHLAESGALISNSGIITSNGFAIITDRYDFNATIVDNSGHIIGSHIAGSGALDFETGQAIIHNSGEIDGNVVLGDLPDVYNGTTGVMNGFVLGGDGDDTIFTGAGRDQILGGRGADLLDGGAGRDRFYYNAGGESSGNHHDTIVGFDAIRDEIVILGVTGVDEKIATGKLAQAGFNHNLGAAVSAGELAPHHAVIFTPDAGDLAGHTFLVVDANGIAGYQVKQDYVIELRDAVHLEALNASDFGSS